MRCFLPPTLLPALALGPAQNLMLLLVLSLPMSPPGHPSTSIPQLRGPSPVQLLGYRRLCPRNRWCQPPSSNCLVQLARQVWLGPSQWSPPADPLMTSPGLWALLRARLPVSRSQRRWNRWCWQLAPCLLPERLPVPLWLRRNLPRGLVTSRLC